MKKKILLLIGIFSIGITYAQVGINTKTPQGVFHIDGKGNTNGTNNVSDDFVIKSDGSGGVSIGIGAIPEKGASVDLASPKMGLSLNKVPLSGTNDLTTVPSPVQGMVVYNTSNNSELYPGICAFNKTTNKWEQMAFTKNLSSVQIAVSLRDVTTTPVTAAHINSGGYSGVVIPFAPLGSSTSEIKITDDGTYAFALNLMGFVDTSGTSESHLYLFMMRKSDMTIMDAAALGTLSMNNPPKYKQSATAILSSELKSGDEIDFLICHNADTPFPWTLFGGATTTSGRYNKTTLSYWKL